MFKKRYGLLLWVLLIGLTMLPFQGLAADKSTTEYGNVQERIQQQSEFNPEQVGGRLEQKGAELLGLAQSGSRFYIAAALVVFGVLLVAGLFAKKVMGYAFLFLVLALAGYLIIQYWSQIQEFVLSFFGWMFDEGGDSNQPSSGV